MNRNKQILSLLKLIFMIIIGCLVIPAQADEFGTNLVINGDAESVSVGDTSVTTFPGWVSDGNVSIQKYGADGGFPTASDPGSPTRANNFFYGGDVDLATASQTIDIAFAATEIDEGNVKFDLSAWLGGFSTQEDFASVNINFYDAKTEFISTVTLDPVLASDRSSLTGLLQRSKSGLIPKDSRSIVVEMILIRKTGTANDGYVDDISLVLNKTNTPSASDCTSIYKQDGSLHVPCVTVPDAFGGRVKYDANLQFVPFSNPFRFELKNATQTAFTPDDCLSVYELVGTLHLPCVSVPIPFGGEVLVDAHLHLVPASDPLQFELDQYAVISNPTSPVEITSGLPGIGTDSPNLLLVALPIQNIGMTTAQKVKITSIKLDPAALIGSVSPASLGDLIEGAVVTINAQFDRSSLTPGSEYPLSVTGEYEAGGTTHSFTLNSTVTAPSNASSGEFIAKVSTSKSVFISNPKFYPVPADLIDNEEEGRNPEGAPVPIGKTQLLFPAAFSTKFMGEQLPPVNVPGAAVPTVSFGKDTPFGRNNGGTPVDPSGASGVGANAANVVLTTGNTYASVSVDGGQTFTNLNPFCMFGYISCDAAGNQIGSPLVDGNLCCDQVIHYAPSINRFIWLMQTWPTNWVNGGNRSNPSGNNRLRIVVVSPDDVRSWATGGASSWLVFDLTTAGLGLTGANDWLDYPDLSIGNNSLYVSVDKLGSGNGGLLVARIPLNQLSAAGTINYRYTNPSDINGRAHGSHLMQNPGDSIFWAGHNATNKLTVFNWPESSNNFAWRDVNINSYSNTDYSSNTPTGTNWLAGASGFGLENVQGAVRVPLLGLCNPALGACPPADELWFAWGAGKNTANNRPQPYVEVVHIDSQSFALKEQMHIWNASYAFAYPAFARNARNEVGVAIGVGGGDREAHTSVGFMGDFTVWSLSTSDSSITRYGDYLTIRKASPNDTLFSAVGYGIKAATGFDPHYVLFGRFCDVNPKDAACNAPVIR